MTITLRPVDPARDFPPIVALINTSLPDPISVAEYAASYQHHRALGGLYRVAVDPQQQVRGYGLARRTTGQPAGHWSLWLGVDPAHRRQGIGAALYTAFLAALTAQGASVIDSEVADACPACRAFAEQRGFRIDRHLFESTLDLTQCDPAAAASAVDAVRQRGIQMISLADLPDPIAAQRQLYELDQTIAQDIPGLSLHGMSFADFQQYACAAPWCEPQGHLIAVAGAAWVGLTLVRRYPERNTAYNLMTGVDRRYRRRGIGRALKLLAIQYAQQRGATVLRTHNDSANAPILALNRALGYQPQPGRYLLRKEIL